MDQYKKQLEDYEYLVIPTNNIQDMYQDESGCVRVVVGVGDDHYDDGTMMLFCDGNSIVNGNLYKEFEGEDE